MNFTLIPWANTANPNPPKSDKPYYTVVWPSNKKASFGAGVSDDFVEGIPSSLKKHAALGRTVELIITTTASYVKYEFMSKNSHNVLPTPKTIDLVGHDTVGNQLWSDQDAEYEKFVSTSTSEELAAHLRGDKPKAKYTEEERHAARNAASAKCRAAKKAVANA